DGLEHGIFELLGENGGDVGLDEAGGYGVGGDVAAGDLAGDGLGEADQARLGRGVVGLAQVAGQAHDARQAYDAAPAVAQHGPQHGAGAAVGRAEVGVHYQVPLV